MDATVLELDNWMRFDASQALFWLGWLH